MSAETTPVSVAEALTRLATIAPALDSERIPLQDALGRVLTTDLSARLDLPNADVSVMDGYCLRAADIPSTHELPLVPGESAAGNPFDGELPQGAALRISTGAVLPTGADAVVPQEEVEVSEGQLHLVDPDAHATSPGRWVRPRGSDVTAGTVVLSRGATLHPGAIALAGASGHAELEVFRPANVTVVSSGDELLSPGQPPGPGQVISTNGLMLAAQLRTLLGDAVRVVTREVADDPQRTHAVLHDAFAHSDLVLTTGGISVGDHDLVLPALQQLGLTLAFRKVHLRPGRPTTAGTVGGVPVLCLPGNPASTLVGFEIFGRVLLRAMTGRAGHGRTEVTARLTTSARGARTRDHYVRARFDASAGTVTPLSQQTSGALTSIGNFDALIPIPAGTLEIPAGEHVSARLVREPT